MESERDTVGSLKEKVSRLLRTLEDCRKENRKSWEELEGLKKKHLETLREAGGDEGLNRFRFR
jgi:hypothetical protein